MTAVIRTVSTNASRCAFVSREFVAGDSQDCFTPSTSRLLTWQRLRNYHPKWSELRQSWVQPRFARIAGFANPPGSAADSDGADGGNRTHTPNREEDFKSPASTVPPRPLAQSAPR